MNGPALAPLRDRPFRWYFASRSVDLVGDMLGHIALAFAVLEVHPSATVLGVVLAAHSIPMVALLLIGGVLADRLGRKQVIQVSNVLAGASWLAMAALLLTGVADVWHLVVLSAANGVAAAANQPALAGLLPQLAPPGTLQQANALYALLRNSSMIVAAAVGASLIVSVGAGWAIAVNGATYLVAAALLVPVALPPPVREVATSMVADLRAGWDFVRHTRWFLVVVLVFSVLNALQSGGLNTLGPALAASTAIGAGGWAAMLASTAVGLALSSIGLLRVRLGRPLLTGMLGISLFSLPMLALGTTTCLPVLLATAFVAGVGIEIFTIGWELAMQENVPSHLLSRAYSYDMLGSFVAIPVGQLAFGPLGEAFGLQRMILLAGGAYLTIALLTLASRSVRELRRTAPLAPVTSTTSAPVS